MAKKKKGNKKPGGYQSPQKTPSHLEEPKCELKLLNKIDVFAS